MRYPALSAILRVTLVASLVAVVGCGRAPEAPRHPSAVQTNPADPWGAYIAEASARFDVPEVWIRSVMEVESRGRTHWHGRPVVSSAGAMGLMQIMPATWEELRKAHGLGTDPHDPRDNILGGTAYIRQLYDWYGAPGFLAAYNAGPGRYLQFVRDGRPLPRETQTYMSILAPQIADAAPAKRGEMTLLRRYGLIQTVAVAR